jgi:hypothetical protein
MDGDIDGAVGREQVVGEVNVAEVTAVCFPAISNF